MLEHFPTLGFSWTVRNFGKDCPLIATSHIQVSKICFFLQKKFYDKLQVGTHLLYFWLSNIFLSLFLGEDNQFDSGWSLSLALWSRSQVLMSFEIDIQQALKKSLPENVKAQAFWNMANCYKVLGEENRALVSFKLVENLL